MNDPFFEERDKICHLRLTEIGTSSFFHFAFFCHSCESRNPYFFLITVPGFPFSRLRAEALRRASTGMTASIVEEDSNF
jgi:hypothetical protein